MKYLYMFLESGRSNSFVIEKCTAPKLSHKIRYFFFGTPDSKGCFPKRFEIYASKQIIEVVLMVVLKIRVRRVRSYSLP